MRPPFAEGAALAALAATLFGATTPLVQRAGRGAGPFLTAALLYGGASAVAAFGLWSARGSQREAPLRRNHLPRLILVAGLGAVLAPSALAWGLARSSGVSASLLLNLEALFTILLAALLQRDPLGRRLVLAAVSMTAGGALLVLGKAMGASNEWVGLAAIGIATAAWALDNAMSRPLSDVSPDAVVFAKSSLGAVLSLGLALVQKDPRPSNARSTGMLLACGALGYGLSLRAYLLAQRRLGAGRTASVFAIAPFVGALVAMFLGEPLGGVRVLIGGALLALGVYLHVTESHEHLHQHELVEHEHAHDHGDGHHDHRHEPSPQGPHSHVHRHEAHVHTHPHGADIHHAHRHDEPAPTPKK